VTADDGAPVDLVLVVVAQPERPDGLRVHVGVIGTQAVNMSRPAAAQTSEATVIPSGSTPIPKNPWTRSS